MFEVDVRSEEYCNIFLFFMRFNGNAILMIFFIKFKFKIFFSEIILFIYYFK